MKSQKKKIVFLSIAIILLIACFIVLDRFNYIPHKSYSTEDFNILPYKSAMDMDNDGIDDQSDILLSARKYLEGKPKYKSKYYASGYSDDEYGVCTDLVANALRGAGYDLMELVNHEVLQNPDRYDIDDVDKNIDFRRVINLQVFFANNSISLTTDCKRIEEWQAGDIVVWNGHIGIISDHRNRKGIPFVLHHWSPFQANYEEDILETWGKIIGHYRMS
ncbi:DUF1287 domain-containing protein [Guggenheimella bovis]